MDPSGAIALAQQWQGNVASPTNPPCPSDFEPGVPSRVSDWNIACWIGLGNNVNTMIEGGDVSAVRQLSLGTDVSVNTARINNALAQGGEVRLPAGSFDVSAVVQVPDFSTLRGVRGKTTLRAASGTNLPAVVASSQWVDTTHNNYVGQRQNITDLVVDGNAGGNPSGGHGIAVMAWASAVERVVVTNTRAEGIHLDNNGTTSDDSQTGTMVECRLVDVDIRDPGSHGVHCANSNTTAGSAVTDGMFDRVIVVNAGTLADGHGIWVERAGGWTLGEVRVYASHQGTKRVMDGVRLDSCWDTRVLDLQVDTFGTTPTAPSGEWAALRMQGTGSGAGHRPSSVGRLGAFAYQAGPGATNARAGLVLCAGTGTDAVWDVGIVQAWDHGATPALVGTRCKSTGGTNTLTRRRTAGNRCATEFDQGTATLVT
jgi:hypothetical protein